MIGSGTMLSIINVSRPLLSVVAPAYEEEKALPHFHGELMRTLEPLGSEYDIEVIYVDDGSTDGTQDVLRRLAETDPHVRYLSLSRNFGHQAALTAGLEHAGGDIIITMDADLQHPPEVIPLLLNEWKDGAEIVITIRADDPTLKWSKRYSSKFFYKLMRWMSGTEVRPSASDFRLMTRPAVAALLQLKESHRFIRGMVQWLGFGCREVHFAPGQRVAGSSKYTLRKQLSLGMNGMLSFSKLPLRLPMYVGAAFLCIGAGCSLFLAIALLVGYPASPIFWGLLAAINVLGGATLFALGIIGEYIGRIYEQVKERPTYLLKECGNLAAVNGQPVPQRNESVKLRKSVGA